MAALLAVLRRRAAASSPVSAKDGCSSENTKRANVIKVENKTQHDAVMSYAPANTGAAAVMVYIQAGGNATVSGVHDGSYDLYETSGVDWDGDAKQFGGGPDEHRHCLLGRGRGGAGEAPGEDGQAHG